MLNFQYCSAYKSLTYFIQRCLIKKIYSDPKYSDLIYLIKDILLISEQFNITEILI